MLFDLLELLGLFSKLFFFFFIDLFLKNDHILFCFLEFLFIFFLFFVGSLDSGLHLYYFDLLLSKFISEHIQRTLFNLHFEVYKFLVTLFQSILLLLYLVQQALLLSL